MSTDKRFGNRPKAKCKQCGFTYFASYMRNGICDDCRQYNSDINLGIDPDNERTCRGCAGSGCSSCGGCGEVRRNYY